MGYDDLKVIEAARFLQSVTDGEQRPPGVHEMNAAARAIAAIARSCESGAWEARRGPGLIHDAGRHLTRVVVHVQGKG